MSFNTMEKFTTSELMLLRDYLKEVINFRGFRIYYYELNLVKSITGQNVQNFYKEVVRQEDHYYIKYPVKCFLKSYSFKTDKFFEKFGMITKSSEGGTKEPPTNECILYGKTPKGLWRNDFGDNTLPDNFIEDSENFLPVVVKIGDVIRYPADSSNFFRVVSFFDFGWGSFILYKINLVQLTAVYNEEALGKIETYNGSKN